MDKMTMKEQIISTADMIRLVKKEISSMTYDPMGRKWHHLHRNQKIKAKIVAALKEWNYLCAQNISRDALLAENASLKDALAKAEPVLEAIRELKTVTHKGQVLYGQRGHDELWKAIDKYREEEAK